MAVTNYYSVEGRILGESTGGVRTDYAPDALGSVAATVDQGSSVVNQYSYKPYGSQLSKSGSGPDPAFRWVGNLGYRHTGKSRSESYVRARHYDQKGGRWTSVDPLWPEQPQYGYVGADPTSRRDGSGLKWYPLTVSALQYILRDIGDWLYWWPPHYGSEFERCFERATGLGHNNIAYQSDWKKLHFGTEDFIPDFVLNLATLGWGTYADSVMVELKAKRGFIGLRYQNGQAGAYIDYLSGSSTIAKRTGPSLWTIRPELHYVTTWDTVLRWNLIATAYFPNSLGVPPTTRKPVALTQTRAEYECRMSGTKRYWVVRFQDWSVPGPSQTVLTATYPPFWIFGAKCVFA